MKMSGYTVADFQESPAHDSNKIYTRMALCVYAWVRVCVHTVA